MDDEYPRKILEESLFLNEKQVFLRNDSLQLNDSFKSPLYSWPSSSEITNLTKVALKSLNPQELFLTNGFKLIFSQDIANLAVNWFMQKFMVIYRAAIMLSIVSMN